MGFWASRSAPALWDTAREEVASPGGQEQKLNLTGT